MIEEIEISNFRAFSKPVKVRLRPITVLIGKNSAGKSTLIKFLLMLRQTLESRAESLLPDFFVTEGRHVGLGGLHDLQNNNPGFGVQRLRFRIQVRSLESPSPAMLQLLESVSGRNGHSPDGLHDRLAQNPRVNESSGEPTDFDIRAELLYRSPAVGRHTVVGAQGGKKRFEFKSPSLKNARFLAFPSSTSRPEGEIEAIARNAFLRPARQELASPRHLSAVREEPPPVSERSNPPADEVGHRGEFTYLHLYKILNAGGAAADFISESIRRIANVDQLEFKSRARDFGSHFRGRNRDTGARCHLKDFGFGVSQCIPIFVQETLLQKGQLLMVEQPEAQIHPTAQLELGSYFADLWNNFGVPSLVETHSDNLFLRLRKLVRQKKLASSDVSIAYFYMENRAVAVKNLDILDDGRIGKGVPMEFFGANILDVLDMQQTHETQ